MSPLRCLALLIADEPNGIFDLTPVIPNSVLLLLDAIIVHEPGCRRLFTLPNDARLDCLVSRRHNVVDTTESVSCHACRG